MSIIGGKLLGLNQLIYVAGAIHSEFGRGMTSSSLQQSFGQGAAAALQDMEGGSHAYEVSLFRAWSEGIEIEDHALQGALARLVQAEPADLLKPVLKGTRLFYVDPLLDLPALRRVFPYLEKSTEGGTRLGLPSLDLFASATPGIPLKSPRDVYALIGSPDHALYLLEKVLYVVPRDGRHERMLPHIQEALEQALLAEIGAFKPTNSKSPVSHPIDFKIPWQDPNDLGPLDLDTIPGQIAAHWRVNASRDFSALADYPSLRQWCEDHRNMAHKSDIQKLLGAIAALWQVVRQAEPSVGQIEGLHKQILGVLGELVMRQPFLEAYRRASAEDAQFILLSEGQMRTGGDQRMTMDLALGRLDVTSRLLHLEQAVEISTAPVLADRSQQQLQHSLENRFPEKGLAIIDESGEWGRVDVDSSNTQTQVVIVPTEEAAALRELVDQAMTEVLGHLALRRGQSRIVPLEERRRYRHSHGRTAAGRLVSWITEGLFGQLDRAKQLSGKHDLYWLDLQLELRLKSADFPELAKKYLRAVQTVLQNVSIELNQTGERYSATAIATKMGVGTTTVHKYQMTIEQGLQARGWTLLPDPQQKKSQQTVAANHATKICSKAWLAADIQGVNEALQTALGNTSLTEETRGFIRAYRRALQNISLELNLTGERRSANAIAAQTGVSQPAIVKYQRNIEQELHTRGWEFLHDPQQKKSQRATAGNVATKLFSAAWQATNIQSVDGALQSALDDPSFGEGTHEIIRAYRRALQNVSFELNPTEERQSTLAIATEAGVGSTTIERYQKAIEKRLQARGWKIL